MLGKRIKNFPFIIEIISIFSLLFILDAFIGEGNRFINIYPHPFWIPVLLMAVQYGTYEGLIASVLSVIILYAGNIPQQSVDENIFEYQFSLSIRPMMWITTSFILGEMRMRLKNALEQAKEDLRMATIRAEKIANNYEILKSTKESLETRLAGNIETIANIYDSLRGLESLKPVQILNCLDVIVQKSLRPEKFSVFANGPNGLEATTSSGWEKCDKYLRRFETDHKLYVEIVKKKRLVVVINQDDEKIMDDEGIMANPLIENETDYVFGMIKIEKIDFLKLNIGNLQTFKFLCELIGNAYSKATRFQSALKSKKIYDLDDRIFSYEFYKIQRAYFEKIFSGANLSLSNMSLEIKCKTPQNEKVVLSLHDLLKKILPEDVSIFIGKEINNMQILFPKYSVKEVENISYNIVEAVQKEKIFKDITCYLKVEELLTSKKEEAYKYESEFTV